METLYFIFLSPIEAIIEISFYFFTDLIRKMGIDSSGFAIILLSLWINFLLMIIFSLIKDNKNKSENVEKLEADIKRLKKYYKGRKFFFYRLQLYKIYGYSPLSDLKASLNLLLIIPIFFIVYHFLGNLDTLKGQSFLFIKDLALPDNFLFGINLLPLWMLGFNILSTYYFTNNKKERLTHFLVGLIFFVLLYGERSALLLYWTTSNLISLIKNRYFK